jgi:hypothetical protein
MPTITSIGTERLDIPAWHVAWFRARYLRLGRIELIIMDGDDIKRLDLLIPT